MGSARRSLTPENLAYAAIRAMAASVHEAHGFLTPEQYRDHVAWTSAREVRYEEIGIGSAASPCASTTSSPAAPRRLLACALATRSWSSTGLPRR